MKGNSENTAHLPLNLKIVTHDFKQNDIEKMETHSGCLEIKR
ncbi:hypothetical protein JCM19233_6207 [Vibrio astriarenae]|nr:hypothetical protein JCM19233_6207 [Vibrio sp. C7]